MKLMTRDTDYAIRALCCIVRKKESIVSVNDLVKCLKMPRAFLRKILQKLNKAKILKSCKGKGGGFSLVVKPNKILIGKMIEIFQGPIKLQVHMSSKKKCPEIKTCLLKKKLDAIEEYVVLNLNSITLASLLKKGK